MNQGDIERRFISGVIADPDGARAKECQGLSPEAFTDWQHRSAWESILAAECPEAAVIACRKYLNDPSCGAMYEEDRDAMWLHWLKSRGLGFVREWLSTLPATKSSGRFPAIEYEPIERDVLAPGVPVVDGLLEAGDKMSISSGSKSFKTWLLIQLAYAINTGTSWLGFNTRRTRVLFLNFEIKPLNFWKRVFRVRRAMRLDKADDFAVWNLRGRGFSMDHDADELIKRAKDLGAGVIVLDPIYKLFGDRNESSAGDMSTLMALFDKVATATGAAIVFAHHFAKGSAGAKDPMDRASGSGVFARDPDCILTLTRLQESEGLNTFAVDVTLREFAPIDRFGLRREHPLMVRDDTVNPANLHEPGARQSKYSPDQLVSLLPTNGGGLTIGQWQDLAAEKLGMTRSTFYEHVRVAKKQAQTKENKWLRIAA